VTPSKRSTEPLVRFGTDTGSGHRLRPRRRRFGTRSTVTACDILADAGSRPSGVEKAGRISLVRRRFLEVGAESDEVGNLM
jgi:hypothetical protein